jgi:hypothetical protein
MGDAFYTEAFRSARNQQRIRQVKTSPALAVALQGAMQEMQARNAPPQANAHQSPDELMQTRDQLQALLAGNELPDEDRMRVEKMLAEVDRLLNQGGQGGNLSAVGQM